jgi:hypothetical protein
VEKPLRLAGQVGAPWQDAAGGSDCLSAVAGFALA